MTVIAYRDGILAADSGNFSGGMCWAGADKIARATDGTLYGATGIAAECEAFLAWVRAGGTGDPPAIRRTKEAESDDAIHVLRVRPNADPEKLTGYGVETFRGLAYIATGAGQEVAMGALHAGASAIQAVEAAIAHSQWAHGPVRWIDHDGCGSHQAILESFNRYRSNTDLTLK